MNHTLTRRLAAVAAAGGLVAGGIALNLSILSDSHWGPGGLTLGAPGVERAQESEATSRTTPRSTDSTRTARTTSTTVTPPTTVLSRPPQPFSPRRPPVAETAPQEPATTAPTTSAPSPTTRPRTPTTRDPQISHTQTFRVATWASATATPLSRATLRVTTKVKRGWTVNERTKTGRDVTLRFRNGDVEILFHARIVDGRIETTSKRIKHDS